MRAKKKKEKKRKREKKYGCKRGRSPIVLSTYVEEKKKKGKKVRQNDKSESLDGRPTSPFHCASCSAAVAAA